MSPSMDAGVRALPPRVAARMGRQRSLAGPGIIGRTKWSGNTEPFGDTEVMMPPNNEPAGRPMAGHDHPPDAVDVAAVLALYDALMRRIAGQRQPEIVDLSISMSQTKVLMLLGAARELHMSALVSQLGLSLSTVSGLVDRLVEQGYALRHDDPADRRQVVVTITDAGSGLLERFRELGGAALRQLLETLSSDELATVGRAVEILDAAVTRSESATVSGIRPAPSTMGDPT